MRLTGAVWFPRPIDQRARLFIEGERRARALEAGRMIRNKHIGRGMCLQMFIEQLEQHAEILVVLRAISL